MNWLDYILLLIVGLSTLFAAMRGFMREVVSLVAWVAAYLAATQLGGHVEPYVAPYFRDPGLASMAAVVVAFVAALVAMWLLGHMLKLMVASVGLSWMDRLLGMLFGAARGILIVLLAFLGLLALDWGMPEAVGQSRLSPYGIDGARQLGRLLPEGSAMFRRIRENYQEFQEMLPAMNQAAEAVGEMRRRAAEQAVAEQAVAADPPIRVKPKKEEATPAKKDESVTGEDVQQLDQLLKKLNKTP